MPKISHIELTSRSDGGPIDLDDFKRKSWPGITAEQVRIAPTSYEYVLNQSSNVLVSMNIYRADGETLVDNAQRTTAKDLRNKLTYIPAGHSVSGWSRLTKPGSYTAVYFNQDRKEQAEAKLRDILPALHFEDYMLRSVVMAFDAILRDASLDIDGYSETLGTLLVYELSRLNRQLKLPALQDGGLSPQQVQRVLDHIEGHLNNRITIADLAALVALSRFHFIRAFKKSVGIPPHQFIMRRRVERAKEMLADGKMSVTEVALGTGFNSLTQLTRVFRQIVGVTPTTFRRDSN
jgi:AraC family transcriptional regulator